MDAEFLLETVKKVLEMGDGDALHNTVNGLNAPELCT